MKDKNKKYEIFLFDLDDTLFNTSMSNTVALKAIAFNYGFAYNDNVRQIYREENKKCWEKYFSGEITVEGLLKSRITEFFKSINVHCDAQELYEKDIVEFIKCVHLIDGAVEVCRQIVSAGKLIYITTNGIQRIQESRINSSLIKEYITDTFAADRVGHVKPNEKHFEYVFKHIPKVGKDKILIIGDSLQSDILGGKNVGMDSCYFNPIGGTNTTSILPTYEIKKLIDLQVFI